MLVVVFYTYMDILARASWGVTLLTVPAYEALQPSFYKTVITTQEDEAY